MFLKMTVPENDSVSIRSIRSTVVTWVNKNVIVYGHGTDSIDTRSIPPWWKGALTTQWLKCWPTDLAVLGSSPARVEIFSTVNRVHFTQPFIIIRPSSWYDWNTVEKDVKSRHPSIHPSIHPPRWKHWSYKHQLLCSLFSLQRQTWLLNDGLVNDINNHFCLLNI